MHACVAVVPRWGIIAGHLDRDGWEDGEEGGWVMQQPKQRLQQIPNSSGYKPVKPNRRRKKVQN